MDMYDFIPSASVREYAKKTGRIFTDAETAALIYHNNFWDVGTKQAHLREIADTTRDISLKKQIKEQLAYENACIRRVSQGEEAGCVYKLSFEERGEIKSLQESYFTSFHLAKQYAERVEKGDPDESYTYEIEKIWLVSEDARSDGEESDDGIRLIGSLTYKSGRLIDYYVPEIDEYAFLREHWPDKRNRFEESFIDIPNPFSKGDIVRVLNAFRGEEIGVVYSGHEWLDEHRDMIPGFSWDEPMVIVELMDDEARFGHYHAFPSEVEFCELEEGDPRKEVLEVSGHLLRGKTDIEMFQIACEEYVEKGRREAAWRENIEPRELPVKPIRLTDDDIVSRMDEEEA